MSKVHSYLYRQVLAIRTGLGDGHVYTLEETARIFHITEADVADIEMEAIEQVDPVLIARAQNCGVQKDEE